MTGARITIDVDDAPVLAILGQLSALMTDLTPVMQDIGAGMVSRIEIDRFEQGRGPGGVPWRPSQRAVSEGRKTLIDRGRLRDSVTFNATPRSVEVGTNVEYSAIHQFGGEINIGASRREVAFRRVKGTNAAGETFSRSLFARMKDGEKGKAHKRVTTRAVDFPARSLSMPARPFLGFDDADRDDVTAIITEQLLRISSGGGASA